MERHHHHFLSTPNNRTGRGLESQLTHIGEHNNTTGDDLLIHSVETTFNSFLLEKYIFIHGQAVFERTDSRA